jgi:hypothetical protein
LQVTHVRTLGVQGLTPLCAKMSSKGLDGVIAVCVHHLTLTNPGTISKDIGARTSCPHSRLKPDLPRSPGPTNVPYQYQWALPMGPENER